MGKVEDADGEEWENQEYIFREVLLIKFMSLFDENLVEKTPLYATLEYRFNKCCNGALGLCWAQNITANESIERTISWELWSDFEQWINFREGREFDALLIGKDLKVEYFRDSNDRKCIAVTYTITLHYRKNKENQVFEFNKVYSLTPVGMYGSI